MVGASENPGLNWTKVGLKGAEDDYDEALYTRLNWTKVGLKVCFLTLRSMSRPV